MFGRSIESISGKKIRKDTKYKNEGCLNIVKTAFAFLYDREQLKTIFLFKYFVVYPLWLDFTTMDTKANARLTDN